MPSPSDQLAVLNQPPRLMRAAVGVRGPNTTTVVVADQRFARGPDPVWSRLAPAIADAIVVSDAGAGTVVFDAHVYDELTQVTVASVRLACVDVSPEQLALARCHLAMALAVLCPVRVVEDAAPAVENVPAAHAEGEQ